MYSSIVMLQLRSSPHPPSAPLRFSSLLQLILIIMILTLLLIFHIIIINISWCQVTIPWIPCPIFCIPSAPRWDIPWYIINMNSTTVSIFSILSSIGRDSLTCYWYSGVVVTVVISHGVASRCVALRCVAFYEARDGTTRFLLGHNSHGSTLHCFYKLLFYV